MLRIQNFTYGNLLLYISPFKPANLNLSKRNEHGGFSSVKEEPTPGTSAAAGPIIRQSSTLNPQPSTSAVSAGPQRFSPRFLGQRKFTSKSGAPKKGKKRLLNVHFVSKAFKNRGT